MARPPKYGFDKLLDVATLEEARARFYGEPLNVRSSASQWAKLRGVTIRTRTGVDLEAPEGEQHYLDVRIIALTRRR